MKEEWRDIAGYEGLYQVSNLGRVRSLDRVVPHARYGHQPIKGDLLLPGKNRDGYLGVGLHKNGKKKRARVHKLVAEAFIGPCPDGMEVCHGVKGNQVNTVANLRYDTHKNNALDRYRDGNMRSFPVRRGDGVEYPSLHIASRETGITVQSIHKVCRKKPHCKTAGGFSWEFI